MADKRVFFVNGPAHPIFTEIVEKRADIRLDKLRNDSPDDVATPILAAAHAYQTGSARDELAKKYHAGPDLLRRTQSLLIVSTNGAGYDTVNLKACTEAGVLCLNQAGGNKEAVAEHALAMMLSLSKRIVEADRAIRREILDRNIFMGHDLLGQTVGIVGLGNVGKRIAELCRGLFQMRVLSYDPYVSAEVMTKHGVEKVDLDTLMRESDFVSINCPLTDESRGLIGEAQYALMKPTAYFVTTARGNIHDEVGTGSCAACEKDRGRRPRRVGKGTAAARSSAAEIRQRDGEPAHRRRHARGARQHGPHRRRADARCPRRQAGRARAQPGGLAALRGALQGDVRHGAARPDCVGRLALCLPGRASIEFESLLGGREHVARDPRDRVRRPVDRRRGAQGDRGGDRRRALGSVVCLLARVVRRGARRHRHGLARGPLRRALDRDVRRRDDRGRLCDLGLRSGLGSGRPSALYIGHGVFIGLLGNAGLNAPLYVYVSRWFDRRRGSALALIASGQYIAGATWPPIFERLIAGYGWRQTMLMFACSRSPSSCRSRSCS